MENQSKLEKESVQGQLKVMQTELDLNKQLTFS